MQLEACIHPFFDELRDPSTRLPNGRPLPPLFNFKPQGCSSLSLCFFSFPQQSLHGATLLPNLYCNTKNILHTYLPKEIMKKSRIQMKTSNLFFIDWQIFFFDRHENLQS